MTELEFGDIGGRIAYYRKLNGQSGDELAELAGNGVTRAVLANIETGRKKDISITHLVAIAIALQVPPAALILDEEAPESPSPISLPVYDEEGNSTVAALNTYWAAAWLGGRDPDMKNALRHGPAARKRQIRVSRAYNAYVQALSMTEYHRSRIESLLQEAGADDEDNFDWRRKMRNAERSLKDQEDRTKDAADELARLEVEGF